MNSWIEDIHLDRTEEKTDNNQQYKMNISCSIDYNSTDKRTVRFIMYFALHSSKKYKLKATQYTLLKFEKEISADQAEEEMLESDAPSLFYPYIRAFAINLLSSAGYGNVLLPLVFFKEE